MGRRPSDIICGGSRYKKDGCSRAVTVRGFGSCIALAYLRACFWRRECHCFLGSPCGGGFRPDSLPILVHITDAIAHDPIDYVGFADAAHADELIGHGLVEQHNPDAADAAKPEEETPPAPVEAE